MVKTIEEMEGLIYLEDGTVFKGIGFGARGTAVGELVFNTSMTGYQKILTDHYDDLPADRKLRGQ